MMIIKGVSSGLKGGLGEWLGPSSSLVMVQMRYELEALRFEKKKKLNTQPWLNSGGFGVIVRGNLKGR